MADRLVNFDGADDLLRSPWTLSPTGSFGIRSGKAQYLSTATAAIAIYGEPVDSQNMLTEVEIHVSLAAWIVATRVTGDGANYYGVRRASPTTMSIVAVVGGAQFATIGSAIAYAVPTNTPYSVRVQAVGSEIRAWVNPGHAPSLGLTGTGWEPVASVAGVNGATTTDPGIRTDTRVTGGLYGAFRISASGAQGTTFDGFRVADVVAVTDTTPPSAPGLSISNKTGTSATLNISTPSTDASGISKYDAWSGATDQGPLIYAGPSTAIPLSGLTPGATYTYSVKAYDNSDAKNPGPLSSITFTTLSDAPVTTGNTLFRVESVGATPDQMDDREIRVFDGVSEEIGLDYGNTLSYWDGSTETKIELPDANPSISPWLGRTYRADGDSSNVPQGNKGSNGIDYDSTEVWGRLVAGGWSGSPSAADYPNGLGVTVSNKHANSSTYQDVLNRQLTIGTNAWIPKSFQLQTIVAGGNDVGKLARSAAGRRGIAHSLRGLHQLHRIRERITTFAESGAWSASAWAGSGNSRVTTANGATLSAKFTGADATLFLMGQTSGAGSAFEVYVDGVLVQTGTTKDQYDVALLGGTYGAVPIMLRGYASQSEHTVLVKHVGANGDPLVVDSLCPWLANEAEMPFVLIAPPAYSTPEGWSNYPAPYPTNATVDEVRVIFLNVAREFPFTKNIGYIKGDRINTAFPPEDPNLRIGDGLHPNLQGMKNFASAVLEELRYYTPLS
jgi:hypothetical protein